MNSTELKCNGNITYHNVSMTAYYPSFEENNPRDYHDKNDKKLKNLQDFIDNRVSYITASMDESLKIPYGTPVCIPELNKKFRRSLKFQIRDTSYDIRNSKYTRIDICVRTEVDSYDDSVNQDDVTLVF